jgi:CheY-like chemotaxis protein
MTSVLIVDDEPFILKIVAAVLEDLGFEKTHTAPDAETALELAKRHKPDMVITDVRLPGMNGVELARQIKSNTRTFSQSGRRLPPQTVRHRPTGADGQPLRA